MNSEEESAKLPIKVVLKMMKQELKRNKDAQFWHAILINGIKKGFWKETDSLEYAIEIMKSIDRSFDEKLSYVV